MAARSVNLQHDLTGQRFGLVTAVRRVGIVRGSSVWIVRCDCGKEREILMCNLKRFPPKTHLSCGQAMDRVPSQARYAFKDETGSIYGDWEVRERRANAGGNATWLCQCETCGAQRVISGINLRARPPICECQKAKAG